MKVKVYIAVLWLVWLGSIMAVEAQEGPKVTVQELKGFHCAVLDGSGSYQKMEQTIVAFMTEFFKQGLVPGGPMISVYLNDPHTTAEADLKWAVGFVIAPGTKINEPLRLMEFKDHRAAVYLHVGPYDQLPNAYNTINAFISEQALTIQGVPYERYLNNPMEVKPAELQTEIVVPVESK